MASIHHHEAEDAVLTFRVQPRLRLPPPHQPLQLSSCCPHPLPELRRHEGVRDCLVFGVPSRQTDRGEQIVAAVVGNAGLSLVDLTRFAGGALPDWQVPKRWWLLDSLEADARGKVSRRRWRRRYLSKETEGKSA